MYCPSSFYSEVMSEFSLITTYFRFYVHFGISRHLRYRSNTRYLPCTTAYHDTLIALRKPGSKCDHYHLDLHYRPWHRHPIHRMDRSTWRDVWYLESS